MLREHLAQVWKTPSKQKMVSPMQLLRTYGGCADEVTALDWSPDSLWLAAASKDITARVFSLHPVPGYIVPTLTGHRAGLVAVFFASLQTRAAAALDGDAVPAIYTLSSDGALHAYSFLPAAQVRCPRDKVPLSLGVHLSLLLSSANAFPYHCAPCVARGLAGLVLPGPPL